MTRPVRFFRMWIGVGLVLRLAALGLWGTFDTEVQKAWSARAASAGLADIYGPPDRELLATARDRGGSLVAGLLDLEVPKATFRWGTADYFVDYPPGSVLVLWAAGRLYGLAAPGLPNRPLFNAAINLAPLVASCAIAFLLRRSAEGGLGQSRALLFWLNPAVYLAAPVLGYQDPIFAALALAAVLALMRGRPVAAAALVVAAALVKPQGALLLPVLAAVLLRETRPRAWLQAALASLATAVLILLPWWSGGYLLSALDGFRRPLSQGTLAPLGLNVWWIAGYAMRWARGGPWPLAEIVTIDAFRDWAGLDPRLVSRLLLAGVTLVNLWLLVRAPREDRRMIPLSVILQVHAYALLGTSVHENHTFLAMVLAPLLFGVWPHARGLWAGASAFLFASLYLTAGLGRRITTQSSLESLRAAFGVDLSVLVAVAHVAFVAVMIAWVARTASGRVRSIAP
jgi:hypothetical protein